jgi:zinc/manganese transport system substrate-binding protein
MKTLRQFLACLAVVIALGARAAEPLVIATNPVLADIVRQVAGNLVRVEVLLPPGASSREYEATEETAQKLADAALVVANGAGYEPWLDPLLKLARYTGPLLDATANVPVYDQSGTLHQPEADESGKNLFEVTDFDPFAWHDPRNVVLYAESVAQGLTPLVPPERQKEIDANLARFSTDLRAAHQEAQTKLAAIPAARRRLVTPYDAFRYLAVAYGLQVSNIPGLAGGTDPRPAALERLLTLITQLRATAVFLEPNASPRTLQRITTETGAKTITSLIPEGLGPEGSPTGTYLGMFRANVNAIADALK